MILVYSIPGRRENGAVGGWLRIVQYAELHCKSNFSFLEGASHAEELAAQAAALGYAALAATDRNSLAGVVRAHLAAKEAGLKLIVGAEITPVDAPPVVLWASDRRAYGRLSRLITAGRRRAPKGECQLTVEDIAEHAEGLLAGVTSPASGRRKPADGAQLHGTLDAPHNGASSSDASGGLRPPLASADTDVTPRLFSPSQPSFPTPSGI
jgi:hypothetical protein